jgi:hypothetical protein
MQSWPNLDTMSAFNLEGQRKTRNSSFRIVRVPANIRTKHLSNAIEGHFHYEKISGYIFSCVNIPRIKNISVKERSPLQTKHVN